MKNIAKKMLVTCAFPYANGDIHIGHLFEQIQADIWVRYHRMRKNIVTFICSDDSHGTAILLKSKELGIDPNKLIIEMKKKHQKIFSNFSISHDYYSSTHTDHNKKICKKIFNVLMKKKLIIKKKISQLYDKSMEMFLSDRLIQGSCPICHIYGQYGDHCGVCGSVYNAIQLINPTSVLSNTRPIIRCSTHFFFRLSYVSDFLKKWICSGVLHNSVVNKVKEWIYIGLRDWDISRDSPYFGFNIPGYLKKYFYVWWDAPIGYISSVQEFCDVHLNLSFYDFWKKNSTIDLYHFIGKDIIYFHSLFWPAILYSYGYRMPTKIFVHGYVNFNGSKLSKSKGSLISADYWLSYFDSDSLRYYFSSKLSNSINDLEFNLKDYMYKINSDIVNNIINLAARSSSFLKKYFFNTLSDSLTEPHLYKIYYNSIKKIEFFFENRQFCDVIKEITLLSDIANKYISEEKPWILIKDNQFRSYVHIICSMGINFFRILMIFLKPIIPKIAKKSEFFLNSPLLWENIRKPLLNHKINNFENFYVRIKKEDIINFLKNIV